MVATGDVALESEKAKLPYDVCVEAKEVDLEQKTRGNILLSTSKFAKEGYVLVYDKKNSTYTMPLPQTLRLMAKQ